MSKMNYAAIAKATIETIELGTYQTATGKRVSIKEDLERAKEDTFQLMPQDTTGVFIQTGQYETKFEVCQETTLEGARHLALSDLNVAVLNFASAKRPGGGFMNGAGAQEESLARSSGLYHCLLGNEMYAYHRMIKDPHYTDRMIYSPGVPVFKDDEGTLLEHPYRVAFVTAPAVNAGAARRRGGDGRSIEEIMKRRIHRVLGLMHEREHDALVLGAWGCGVFKNDPDTIARLFEDALTIHFFGCFKRVRFSVYDNSDGPCLQAFERRFFVS